MTDLDVDLGLPPADQLEGVQERIAELLMDMKMDVEEAIEEGNIQQAER